MKRGLILGKFMPVHNGHIFLIDHASTLCDELIVLICATDNEPVPANIRFDWMQKIFDKDPKIKLRSLIYDDETLPNTSISSRNVSKLWSEVLKEQLPQIDIVFSSERYGQYLGEYMNCDYEVFDENRNIVPISASKIRNDPFDHWQYIPTAVRPYYVKKICLYGTESTGKSTLAKRLASYFDTVYVPEMAREIIENTTECTEDHLQEIAMSHAKAIDNATATAKKILLIDTDINITRSYSKFLFNKELDVPVWVDKANSMDLYLYLGADAPYIQDGTRLTETERDRLNGFHEEELAIHGIDAVKITGNWEDRYLQAIAVIKAKFTNL